MLDERGTELDFSKSVVLSGGVLLPMSPGDVWQGLEVFLVSQVRVGRTVLLTSSGERPRMLLNILQ